MLSRLDCGLVLLWATMLVIGLLAVNSATVAMGPKDDLYVIRHTIYILGAISTFMVMVWTPLQLWEKFYRIWLIVAIVLATLVFFPVIGLKAGGSYRWINLGLFTLQASEACKLLLLMYLAGYLTRVQNLVSQSTARVLVPFAAASIVAGLIYLEPDYGAIVILLALTLGLIFVAGARFRDLAILAAIGGAGLMLLATQKAYRIDRLSTFLNPWASPYDSGYQLTQSLIAFGRGKYTGLGLGDGIQKLLYLPEAHNDFIFAVIGEETGFLGAVVVMVLLLLLAVRCIQTGYILQEGGQYFGGYLAYGAGILLGIQTLMNVGVNIGVLPTKGLTLPFVSYGGNSLIICSALIGLVCRARLEFHGSGRATLMEGRS